MCSGVLKSHFHCKILVRSKRLFQDKVSLRKEVFWRIISSIKSNGLIKTILVLTRDESFLVRRIIEVLKTGTVTLSTILSRTLMGR